MKFWIPGLFFFLWGCGHNKPVISGDFGEVVSPNQNQVANIWSKAGEELVKDAAKEAGIHGAIWLVIVLPVLVLGWLVGGYLDSLAN